MKTQHLKIINTNMRSDWKRYLRILVLFMAFVVYGCLFYKQRGPFFKTTGYLTRDDDAQSHKCVVESRYFTDAHVEIATSPDEKNREFDIVDFHLKHGDNAVLIIMGHYKRDIHGWPPRTYLVLFSEANSFNKGDTLLLSNTRNIFYFHELLISTVDTFQFYSEYTSNVNGSLIIKSFEDNILRGKIVFTSKSQGSTFHSRDYDVIDIIDDSKSTGKIDFIATKGVIENYKHGFLVRIREYNPNKD